MAFLSSRYFFPNKLVLHIVKREVNQRRCFSLSLKNYNSAEQQPNSTNKQHNKINYNNNKSVDQLKDFVVYEKPISTKAGPIALLVIVIAIPTLVFYSSRRRRRLELEKEFAEYKEEEKEK